MRVLIADDEPSIRELLRVHLEMAEHDVVGEAVNGEQVLELADSTKPDLIVLDIMMPKLDGHDVLRFLRMRPPQRPAIVAFSAAPNALAEAMNLGADAAVVKDGDFERLLTAIEAF